MNRIAGLISTSIGQKLILAGSGLALVGFLLVHMLGNLTIFQGREAMNAYAYWLQGHPLLWLARVGLISVFLIHTTLALKLAWENHRSRPVAYHHARAHQESTMLSRYIALTGLLVLSFLVYHVLHFTIGAVLPEYARTIDSAGRHDVYSMVVRSFQVPAVATAYLVAMTILGLHLAHGLKSLAQTLGLHHESYIGPIRIGALVLCAVIVLGNASIPLSVWMGWVQP